MTTSLHSPISMQITLTPSDLTEARLLLPHQIRVWGNQVDDILVLVDLPPWRTRDAAAVQAQQELAGFLDRQRVLHRRQARRRQRRAQQRRPSVPPHSRTAERR